MLSVRALVRTSKRGPFAVRESELGEFRMRKIITMTALLLAVGTVGVLAQPKVERTEDEKKALAKIRQLGGLALELAQNDPRLEVSYPQSNGKFSDEHLASLKDLKGLVHLNLRNQPLTDEQAAQLKGLTELTRLHLEKT